MVQLLDHFNGWYRTTKRPYTDVEDWIKLDVKKRNKRIRIAWLYFILRGVE